VSFRAYFRWLRVSAVLAYRIATWGVLVITFILAAIVLSLRYWFLPNAEHYREDIAQAASAALGQRITIGRITANWDGLRPELVFEDITVFDRSGRPGLELKRVDNTFSWLSLAVLEPRFHEIEIHRPALEVRRDERGTLWIAGIELKDERGSGFAEWLLRQGQIVVRDATITWRDELRNAPALELAQVRLRISNRGSRHRFGLQAVPPKELAGLLDVRGEWVGEDLSKLPDWQGRLFVQLDYADIAAWRRWVAFPLDVPQGMGGIRLWLTYASRQLTELIADVRLADVRTRLAPELPELDLAALSGRAGWKNFADGFEFSASKLGLRTRGGLTLQPVDFLLKVRAAAGKPGSGEIRANALDLEPLAALAEHLPLDAELRKRLAEAAPRGSFFDLVLRWTGDWRAPTHFSARGRFHELALARHGVWPGFRGLTGSLDGSDRSGTLDLKSVNAEFVLPSVFREPIAFDALNAQLSWIRVGAETELRVSSASFSNAHAAGTLVGSYRTTPDGPGAVDMAGNLTRADARYVGRYVPLKVKKAIRDWLDTSLIAGKSNDVAFRIKGNLKDFPFPDNKGGTFYVTAKVTDGVLDYAGGWPRVENIAGEFAFRGKRMDVTVREGTILGARLVRVKAEVPDLITPYEILRIDGEARGPTAEFLAFIEKSPVSGMIDRFTEGMQAQGDGRLALKLEMPLQALEKSRISGVYQFAGNRIVADPDLPPLEQANGRIEFTEAAVRVPGASGTFLGGPVSITAATRNDGTVRVDMQGRANIDNLRRSAGNPWWTQFLTGATDWRGALVLRKKMADLTVETGLQGIASSLPPPFEKAAADVVAVRYERRFTGPQQDRVSFSYGNIVSAQLVRQGEGAGFSVRRGIVQFGGPAGEPDRDGVWVRGALPNLDLDRWLEFVRRASGQTALDLAGIEVKLGELTALNRVFHNVGLSASLQDGTWRAQLAGREFEGAATWNPQGRGKLTARMKKLMVPPARAAAAPPDSGARDRELPALDVVAEQFQFKDKALGRLELVAVPEERDWRIERIHLVSPESRLAANGVLRAAAQKAHTSLNLRLEIADIGKFLARLGYPEGVRRGTAKIEGTLNWPGYPQDFDYPMLSGNLVLDAEKGQFVKLEPGIGKLLGILSLQALPRRITLDFRDIFSEGFAFDQIIGTVKIERGIATTENFRIQGPSARVLMTGEIDLARETQKLNVRITPSISDSVSIAGAIIGGPVAGVATFLAQKMLKDPFEQIVSYEYRITGTWSEPQVSKPERPAPSESDKPS
jgi:uncharacterized protein (TIGR02099 family)